jgi:hypothetical protein
LCLRVLYKTSDTQHSQERYDQELAFQCTHELND